MHHANVSNELEEDEPLAVLPVGVALSHQEKIGHQFTISLERLRMRV
jgi:hypothetical protein